MNLTKSLAESTKYVAGHTFQICSNDQICSRNFQKYSYQLYLFLQKTTKSVAIVLCYLLIYNMLCCLYNIIILFYNIFNKEKKTFFGLKN